MDYYGKNRHLYLPNMEFEAFCEAEINSNIKIKEDLIEKQNTLDKMIVKQQTKQFKLNQMLMDLNCKEKQFEQLKSEKEKMQMANIKMQEMRNTLENERYAFEKEKQKFIEESLKTKHDDFTIDEFLMTDKK